MLKRILFWQSKFNKFLQMYLLASSVFHFSTNKESVIILKMTNI